MKMNSSLSRHVGRMLAIALTLIASCTKERLILDVKIIAYGKGNRVQMYDDAKLVAVAKWDDFSIDIVSCTEVSGGYDVQVRDRGSGVEQTIFVADGQYMIVDKGEVKIRPMDVKDLDRIVNSSDYSELLKSDRPQ